MNHKKLKPCPFCGDKANYWRASKYIGDGHYTDIVFVRCKNCRATTKEIEYDARIHKNDSEYDEVAGLWNNRLK